MKHGLLNSIFIIGLSLFFHSTGANASDPACVKNYNDAVYFANQGADNYKAYMELANEYDDASVDIESFKTIKPWLETLKDLKALRRQFISLVEDYDTAYDRFYRVKRNCPDMLSNELGRIEKIFKDLSEKRKNLITRNKEARQWLKDWNKKMGTDSSGKYNDQYLDPDKYILEIPYFSILD